MKAYQKFFAVVAIMTFLGLQIITLEVILGHDLTYWQQWLLVAIVGVSSILALPDKQDTPK